MDPAITITQVILGSAMFLGLSWVAIAFIRGTQEGAGYGSKMWEIPRR